MVAATHTATDDIHGLSGNMRSRDSDTHGELPCQLDQSLSQGGCFFLD
jgi:hypothetical protein